MWDANVSMGTEPIRVDVITKSHCRESRADTIYTSGDTTIEEAHEGRIRSQ